MNKYGNEKINFNGMTFDSKKEFTRWCELNLLIKARKISDLSRQIKFILVPAQRGEDGKLVEREVSYLADFVYYDKDKDMTVVEDTKGMRTKDYIIKRKLMLYVHGIKIKEV